MHHDHDTAQAMSLRCDSERKRTCKRVSRSECSESTVMQPDAEHRASGVNSERTLQARCHAFRANSHLHSQIKHRKPQSGYKLY
eukprot:2458349-Rhodomonas_salina.1